MGCIHIEGLITSAAYVTSKQMSAGLSFVSAVGTRTPSDTGLPGQADFLSMHRSSETGGAVAESNNLLSFPVLKNVLAGKSFQRLITLYQEMY